MEPCLESDWIYRSSSYLIWLIFIILVGRMCTISRPSRLFHLSRILFILVIICCLKNNQAFSAGKVLFDIYFSSGLLKVLIWVQDFWCAFLVIVDKLWLVKLLGSCVYCS